MFLGLWEFSLLALVTRVIDQLPGKSIPTDRIAVKKVNGIKWLKGVDRKRISLAEDALQSTGMSDGPSVLKKCDGKRESENYGNGSLH